MQRLIDKTLLRFGYDAFARRAPDRGILMEIILPAIAADPQVTRVLFVGCDYYTKGYERKFKAHEYWTIDPLPKMKRYGSRRHIVGKVEHLKDHFAPQYFDAVICHGVFGWGVNDMAAAESMFTACYDALRDGGLFVFGWVDDGGARCPFPPEQCSSLARFERSHFAPLCSSRYVTATDYRATFLFLQRPACATKGGADQTPAPPVSGKVPATARHERFASG